VRLISECAFGKKQERQLDCLIHGSPYGFISYRITALKRQRFSFVIVARVIDDNIFFIG
jgi:hypothetical protein